MAYDVRYDRWWNAAVQLLADMGAAKDLHAVPWRQFDACLFRISSQI
jgi:hypothetical protein